MGIEVAHLAKEKALELYTIGSEYAIERGIIIADTKFEMGFVDGDLVGADEILTPDSSRFWPRESWKPGSTPPSFDKQPVRDFLDGLDWDKSPPPPELPQNVITASAQRYREGYEKISNKNLDDWPGN